MNLLLYPSLALETKCEPVLEFNEELGTLLDEMKKVMLEHNGLGLSANQLGVMKKVVVIQTAKKEIYELVNPLILDVTDEVTMSEGCLSSPGIYLNISRPASVLFQYQDRTGEVKKVMAEGIEARTVLHEVDHTNGIFFFSKVNRKNRKTASSKLKKSLK